MLYLSRKIGESIIINNDIEVKLIEVKGKVAKIGISTPKDGKVMRKELHDQIATANEAAKSAGVDDLKGLGDFKE